MNSFKSCVKLKKHRVCFLGFIVLLFWGFFPSWEIFLKSKWRILASFIFSLFFFFILPSPLVLLFWLLCNFRIFMSLGRIFCSQKHWRQFPVLYISVLHFDVLYVNWFGNLVLCRFFINKMPGVLTLFLATCMVI